MQESELKRNARINSSSDVLDGISTRSKHYPRDSVKKSIQKRGPKLRRRSLKGEDVVEALSNTGFMEDVPIEVLEAIMGQVKGRDLGSLSCTCKYFMQTGLVESVAESQVNAIPRAKGIKPNTLLGETWAMLSYYFQCQSAAAAQATTMAMGRHHTAALMVADEPHEEDRRGGEIGLYAFGRGFYGQLGNGQYESRPTPHRIRLGSSPWSPTEALPAVVCCGSSHTVSLSRKGDMFSWGLGSSGELGHGTSEVELAIPRPIGVFERRRIVSVAAGAHHTLAIDESGALWACGKGKTGQLGIGAFVDDSPFLPVSDLRCHKVVSAAAGVAHSVALAADGSVFTWGDGRYGQLGQAPLQTLMLPQESICLPRPWKLHMLDPRRLEPADRVTAIAAGGNHTMLLTVSGGVLAFGRNHRGQLGVGTTEDAWQPVPVTFPADAVAVAAAAAGASPGSSPRGAGCGPATVVRAVQVAAGLSHSVVLLMRAGRLEVRAAGLNTCGQLGTGTQTDSSTFQPVKGLSGRSVVTVVCGDEHNAALGPDGEIRVWGRNTEGQLGLGDDRSRFLPTRLPGLLVVHPDRTLRRRGHRGYMPLRKGPAAAECKPAAADAGGDRGGEATSSGPASPPSRQPGADWIIRRLFEHHTGGVPPHVEDAIMASTTSMLATGIAAGMAETTVAGGAAAACPATAGERTVTKPVRSRATAAPALCSPVPMLAAGMHAAAAGMGPDNGPASPNGHTGDTVHTAGSDVVRPTDVVRGYSMDMDVDNTP